MLLRNRGELEKTELSKRSSRNPVSGTCAFRHSMIFRQSSLLLSWPFGRSIFKSPGPSVFRFPGLQLIRLSPPKLITEFWSSADSSVRTMNQSSKRQHHPDRKSRSNGEERKAAVDRGKFIMNLDCFVKLNTQISERATLQKIEPMNFERREKLRGSS